MLYIGAGVSGWNHYSFEVTAGEHTFMWSYTKDSSVNPTGDHFAVDNVMMGTSEITWNDPISVEDAVYTFTGLNPLTTYCMRVSGVCGETETEWSESVVFTTTEQTTVIQEVALSSGTNWFSMYVDITLDDLKSAIEEALGNTANATLKSQNANVRYTRGRWGTTPSDFVWDVALMYMIEVEANCEITLEGMALDPSEHPITIKQGTNWIGYPFSASKTLTEAFADFAVNGDEIKGMNGNNRYARNRWSNTGLTTLEPGQGYQYVSEEAEDRVLTYPSSAK